MTINTFKSYPKPHSSPMIYPIQPDYKSYCEEFRWHLLLLVLAQLRSFLWFEIIKCLVMCSTNISDFQQVLLIKVVPR